MPVGAPGRIARRCPAAGPALRHAAAAVVVVAAALLVAGCGRSGPAQPRPATTPPASTPGAATGGGTTATTSSSTAPLPGQTTPAQTAAGQPPQLPPAPAPAPGQTAPEPKAPPPPRGRAGVLVIGDSLAVAIAPVLPGLMPNWRVVVDGLGGRPLVAGMQVLNRTTLPKDGSVVLAFSLYTNDDPRNLPALRAAVRTSLQRVGSSGCVVWATIARAPIAGHGYGAANAALRRMARADPRHMQLVDWAARVRLEPTILGPDAIHPNDAGAAIRAQMYADAVRRCPPVGS
jgi:hypothetical protein